MLYLKRILIVGLSFVVGLINIIGNNYTVFALEKNTLVHQNVMSMIQSQRGGLFDPIYTESLEDNWQGDYIYYGEDTDGSALKWQLLDSDNKDFSKNANSTMFLFSDKTIGTSFWYRENDYGFDYSNVKPGETPIYWQKGYEWDKSDLKTNMEDEMKNKFSSIENEGIIFSSKSSEDAQNVAVGLEKLGTTEMTASKWFPLSIQELTNKCYGFSSVPFNRNQAPLGLHTGDKSRVSSDDKNYLIRSYEEHWTKPMENGMRYHPVFVLNSNSVYGANCARGLNYGNMNTVQSMRPAMNIDTSKVMLVKSHNQKEIIGIKAVNDSKTNEFKLTLLDDKQKLNIENIKTERDKITFDFEAIGNGKYLSVVVQDENNNVMYYGNIKDNLDKVNVGTMTIDLNQIGLNSKSFSSGEYKLSIFTEQLNFDKKTDYSSKFVDVEVVQNNVPPAVINKVPTIVAEDKVLTVGDTFDPLKDVTAYDNEDGIIKLTEANIAANDVNTNKEGTYNVTYKVTDKQGASSTKTITIDVIERIVIPENKPVDKTNNDTNSSNSSKLPQTGDINNIGVLAVTLMMSGSIVIGCNRKKSKANSLSEK